MSEESSQFEETLSSVVRITDYDLETLPRSEDLGRAFAFSDAVGPARKVVAIFERLPLKSLNELPQIELKSIEQTADSFYGLLERIESFDPENNTTTEKDQIIDLIVGQHQTVFTKLFPFISYLTARSTDFTNLESDARAAVQKAKKEAETAKLSIEAASRQAETALQTIRETAAEQGVSQQAIHFKTEADSQSANAKKWQISTVVTAFGLGIFAVLSLFLHKWSFLSPNDPYEAIQLGLSKVLIFGVISYMLVLSARNFMAHKHNEIVNRHRQNALVTFRPLVEAASIDEKQDIILDRASEAIFGEVDSGFSKSPNVNLGGAGNIIRMLPRSTSES